MKKNQINYLFEAKDKSNYYYIIAHTGHQVFNIFDDIENNVDWDSFKLSNPLDGRSYLVIGGIRQKITEIIKNNNYPHVIEISKEKL
jgi:hypothetical protein